MDPSTFRDAQDVTQLLHAWSAGNAEALDKLTPLLHSELKRLARQSLMRERKDHTLQPTALVNEAFVRLVNANKITFQDRAHFFALAARMMRRILVDYASARAANKRGGPLARKIPLADVVVSTPESDFPMIDLNNALEKLAQLDARQAQIVDLHFFGSLGWEEIATVLQLSEKTIRRDWNLSKSWLAREMSRGAGAGTPAHR